MVWPDLPYEKWSNTLDTLHMWMEIVGKVKLLELAPFLNHWWEVAFYVTASGITSGSIPHNNEIFQVDFNFLNHTLNIQTSSNKSHLIQLQPMAVADFYHEFMGSLKKMGITVKIWPIPVEVQNPIPFAKDTQHASYDNQYVERWWHILVLVTMVFEQFRTQFDGKSSPIQFFWGSFDLNGARYSGKEVEPPKMKGTMGRIMKFAENEENFAFGFWPGDQNFPHPAFYSYLYPKPPGMERLKFDNGAAFNEQLDECMLLYESVRNTSNPSQAIMQFLDSTYTESAMLAGWDLDKFKTQTPSL